MWLEARSDLNYQRKLLEKRSELEKKIRALLGNAVSERAWMFFVERLTPEKREALNGWREAVRAIGKGTGRSARVASLRRQARAYMKECRDAIPIWIMPRYLVPEYCDTEPGYFDLVIADEASQLGIESMFLFYMAKNIVVVGDDQQISPAGVGVKQDEVSGLQAHYLEGIPHQHALSEKSSLYANAKIRFSQNIVLREHFRCMPEIIQFSNDLCYANNGTPLDPLRPYASNRLVPIVRHYVEKGYNKGGPLTTTNPPEAEAIVAQIAACVDDPRFRVVLIQPREVSLPLLDFDNSHRHGSVQTANLLARDLFASPCLLRNAQDHATGRHHTLRQGSLSYLVRQDRFDNDG